MRSNKSRIEFLSAFHWTVELYNIIITRQPLPFKYFKMVASRFSSKTWSIEQLIALLLIQRNVKVVVNYVRARGEDGFKALDNIEDLIRNYTNNQIKPKPNTLKKQVKVHQNKMNLHILNEIKEKAQKSGGKIGINIEYDADYIITFYEEASQLDKDLVENHSQSVRGSNGTRTLFFYASNPWTKTHWLMREFSQFIPEDKYHMEELMERGYNLYFNEKTETVYFRPRYTLNHHVDSKTAEEIERLKEVNYNKWKIVSLGFSGVQDGALYQASLQKLDGNINPNMDGYLVGGIDWGDGKSRYGSPTTAYFGIVSIDEGIHILEEYEHWNNRDEVLTTQEQLQRICDFYIKHYKKYGKPITVYIDNAALGDFFKMVQEVLRAKGLTEGQIEFLPAFKPKNTWERVETLNMMLSLGILRFDKEQCKSLYKALDNCYEVQKPTPTEEMKRQRSHEWTHWIHAIEYLIGPYFKEFQSQFPIIMGTKTLGNHVY